MIKAILRGIFKLIISLCTLLLTPIDSLITATLPDLSNALNYVNALIDYIINFIGYCVNLTGLSSFAINLIIAYYSFILLSRPVLYVSKLALKWYKALRP